MVDWKAILSLNYYYFRLYVKPLYIYMSLVEMVVDFLREKLEINNFTIKSPCIIQLRSTGFLAKSHGRCIYRRFCTPIIIRQFYSVVWTNAGKGENIWDRWCHEGGHVAKNETGDVACDSYHLYKEDIKLLQNLGV